MGRPLSAVYAVEGESRRPGVARAAVCAGPPQTKTLDLMIFEGCRVSR